MWIDIKKHRLNTDLIYNVEVQYCTVYIHIMNREQPIEIEVDRNIVADKLFPLETRIKNLALKANITEEKSREFFNKLQDEFSLSQFHVAGLETEEISLVYETAEKECARLRDEIAQYCGNSNVVRINSEFLCK